MLTDWQTHDHAGIRSFLADDLIKRIMLMCASGRGFTVSPTYHGLPFEYVGIEAEPAFCNEHPPMNKDVLLQCTRVVWNIDIEIHIHIQSQGLIFSELCLIGLPAIRNLAKSWRLSCKPRMRSADSIPMCRLVFVFFHWKCTQALQKSLNFEYKTCMF